MFSLTRALLPRSGGDRVRSMRLARSLSILSMCLVGMSGLAGYLSAAAAQQPGKAHCAGGRQRRLCEIAACDGGQRRRPDRADPAGGRLRRDRRPRSRWRHAAQEFSRLHQQGGSLGAGHGRDGLSRGLRAAIGRRQLFRAGRFHDQPRHRRSDRGVAGRRLHPATRLAAAEGRHRRAGRGAAAAFRRRTDRKRARTGRGRIRTC